MFMSIDQGTAEVREALHVLVTNGSQLTTRVEFFGKFRPGVHLHVGRNEIVDAIKITFEMDPFSAEGELINLHSHFIQGQWQAVIDYDTSALSSENSLPARVLSLRAQIALGHAEDVIADVQGEKQPELIAVRAFAEYAAGNTTAAMRTVEKLAATEVENAIVQVLCGTVLQAEGLTEEALTLLSKHQGNLEAVALIVQIHLQQNRTDLALKEVQAARRWAQDSLLVNIAESWVGIRMGGDKYQQAFYVFEEMAQAPSSTAPLSLISQAIAEIHLGRYEEAEAALNQAMEKEPENADAIANLIVLSLLNGKDADSLIKTLQKAGPHHAYLKGIEEKSDLFDKVAAKFSAKVTA